MGINSRKMPPVIKPLDERYKIAICEINESLKWMVNFEKAKIAYEKGFISSDRLKDMLLDENKSSK